MFQVSQGGRMETKVRWKDDLVEVRFFEFVRAEGDEERGEESLDLGLVVKIPAWNSSCLVYSRRNMRA